MNYNFDRCINRWNTDSVKYDGPHIELGLEDYTPLWVADMDFQTPQPILDAIQQMLNVGVLGYTLSTKSWSDAIIKWCKKRYNWTLSSDELLFVPGVVRGIASALRCFTNSGDKVLVMSPVYPPFFNVTKRNQRHVVSHKLVIEEGHYKIDFAQFARDIEGCKMLILCNPHNPGGRVWSRSELIKIAEICAREEVIVVSDEIHADLTLPPHQHTPFAQVSDLAKEITITLMAPSKAFNMPGICSSYALIQNESLLKRYNSFVEALDISSGNMFAYRALIAAYEECEDWLPQLYGYIQGNIKVVKEFLKRELPLLGMLEPQASFLIFLDCRALNLSCEELNDFFVKEAKLLLNPGDSFGEEGSGFMRLNIGLSRDRLLTALNQLKKAYIGRGF